MNEDVKQHRKDTRASFRANLKKVYKALRTNVTAPLTFLRRKCTDTTDPRHNTVVTDRAEMDQLIRDAWEHIRAGKADQAQDLVANFIAKYEPFIYSSAEFQVSDVDPDELMAECFNAKHTVASLDNWSTAEFALLPRAAYVMFADFLNRVEREGRWPEQLQIAKAAFFAQG